MAQKMTVDFSVVKDGGGFSPKHKPEGEYLGEVVSFEDGKSKAGNPMWTFGIALTEDRRAVYPVYCVLDVKNYWKLRQLMLGCGFAVPKKKMTVDANRLVGKKVGICLEDDEYDGKMKSVIGSMFPASEYEGPAGSSDDDEEPEEDEEYEEEDVVEEDETEEDQDDADDEDETDEEPEDEVPAKPAKKATKKKPAPEPEEEDEDDDEMDVEDL